MDYLFFKRDKNQAKKFNQERVPDDNKLNQEHVDQLLDENYDNMNNDPKKE